MGIHCHFTETGVLTVNPSTTRPWRNGPSLTFSPHDICCWTSPRSSPGDNLLQTRSNNFAQQKQCQNHVPLTSYCNILTWLSSASLDKVSLLRIPGDRHNLHLGPVKRICVFEHSVMTNFNCACPAIQRGQGSGFLSEGSSWFTACMSEQRRFWRDCADAQARLNLRCSHRR